MKSEVSRPVLIAVVIVVLLLVGFVGYKVLSPPQQVSGDPAVLRDAIARKKAREGDR